MKKLLIFLLTLLFIPSVYALSVEDVPIKDYVNDYADILSPEVEEYIKEESKSLEKADGTQIVIVTIKSLEGNVLEDFTHDLGNYYGIGYDSKGLIIFVSVEDRLARVEVGDNLEGILNDAKVGRYMDRYMIPYLRNDDWDNGIKMIYIALRNEIIEQNHLNIEKTTLADVDNYRSKEEVESNAVVIASMAVLIGSIFIGLIIGNASFHPIDLIVCAILGTPIYIALFTSSELIPFAIFATGFAIFLYFCMRTGHYGSGGSGGGYSGGGGHSSGGGFSGGGGHFSGGGASRGF